MNTCLNYLPRLSRDAVLYALKLGGSDPAVLTWQLYYFNRLPITAKLRKEIGERHAFHRFLGFGDETQETPVNKHWRATFSGPDKSGWLVFQPIKPLNRNQYASTYKLYVSPQVDDVPTVLKHLVGNFTSDNIRQFKVGCDLAGLTRPDKIVAYFSSFEELEQVAQKLSTFLNGFKPHGVPFSCDISGSGILSWGLDPPKYSGARVNETQSWRFWIARTIAAAMVEEGKANESEERSLHSIYEKIRLAGVNTDTWAPTRVFEQQFIG